MKTDWEDLIGPWEALASRTYASARGLTEQDKIVAIYEAFKAEEAALFAEAGWTYEEFKAETLSRAALESSAEQDDDDDEVETCTPDETES